MVKVAKILFYFILPLVSTISHGHSYGTPDGKGLTLSIPNGYEYDVKNVAKLCDAACRNYFDDWNVTGIGLDGRGHLHFTKWKSDACVWTRDITCGIPEAACGCHTEAVTTYKDKGGQGVVHGVTMDSVCSKSSDLCTGGGIRGRFWHHVP